MRMHSDTAVVSLGACGRELQASGMSRLVWVQASADSVQRRFGSEDHLACRDSL